MYFPSKDSSLLRATLPFRSDVWLILASENLVHLEVLFQVRRSLRDADERSP
jgi:hypothetical protein